MGRDELLATLRKLGTEHEQRLAELRTHQEELRAQHEELLHAQREIEGSRDRYAELYDFAPVAYVTLDPNGVVTEINLTGARLLGRDRGRIVGYPFSTFVTPRDRQAFLDHMLHCRRTARGQEVVSELTLRSDASAALPVDLRTRPTSDTRDRRYPSAIIDLTDRRRAEDERLRADRDRQRSANEEQAMHAAAEAKDRFLATLSHELRGPLTSIAFALASIEELEDIPGSLLPTLQMIGRNVRLEARLIDDLLDVTRIERGKLSLRREPIDLHVIVREVADMCAGESRNRTVELAVDPAAIAHHVDADPARLRQVFGNLVSNALRHTPPGGRITLATRDEDSGAVSVIVRDTGDGIAPELMDRIFAPFEQGPRDRQGAQGGLGLGLAICKGIVEAHEGKIAAVSRGAGEGAVFTVRLPTIAPPQAVPSPEPVERAGDGNGRRVLLVEDNQDNLAAIAEFLRLNGYEVRMATSVQDALEQARDGFDVLVSDIGLPDGTGQELVARLCSERPVRAIALSGYGTRDDVERSRRAGFSRHLTKPVEPDQLIDAIESVANGSERARA